MARWCSRVAGLIAILVAALVLWPMARASWWLACRKWPSGYGRISAAQMRLDIWATRLCE